MTAPDKSAGIVVSFPLREYLYSQEWNDEQLRLFLEHCRDLGRRIAERRNAEIERVVFAALGVPRPIAAVPIQPLDDGRSG